MKVDGLQGAIEEILRDYGDVVFEADEAGTDAAAKVLIKKLSVASPKRTGKFARSWTSTGKKFKGIKFVGNTATVKGKDGKEISQADVIEYSTTHGKPFIKQTYESSVNEMAQAYVDAMKNKL